MKLFANFTKSIVARSASDLTSSRCRMRGGSKPYTLPKATLRRSRHAQSTMSVKLADGTIVPTTFSVLDNDPHAEMMKPMLKLYNLHNVLLYEAQIDDVPRILTSTMDTFCDGRVVDIGLQLLCTAYDVIGNITLGTPDG